MCSERTQSLKSLPLLSNAASSICADHYRPPTRAITTPQAAVSPSAARACSDTGLVRSQSCRAPRHVPVDTAQTTHLPNLAIPKARPAGTSPVSPGAQRRPTRTQAGAATSASRRGRPRRLSRASHAPAITAHSHRTASAIAIAGACGSHGIGRGEGMCHHAWEPHVLSSSYHVHAAYPLPSRRPPGGCRQHVQLTFCSAASCCEISPSVLISRFSVAPIFSVMSRDTASGTSPPPACAADTLDAGGAIGGSGPASPSPEVAASKASSRCARPASSSFACSSSSLRDETCRRAAPRIGSQQACDARASITRSRSSARGKR